MLGSGTVNYGHGSIVRGGGNGRIETSMASRDPEELRILGNEQYKKGLFGDALKLYDRAISMNPGSASCHGNKAAALMATGRLVEAARECEEAVRLDPTYRRAHQRLASLYLRWREISEI